MIEINLLPWREIKRAQRKKEFIVALVGALITAVSIILLLNYYVNDLIEIQSRRNQRLQKEIALFKRKIQKIRQLKEAKDKLIAQLGTIQNLQATQILTVHLFDELIKVIPNDIYLTQAKRIEDSVILSGFSKSNSGVSLLMHSIEKHPWLHDPKLNEIKKNKKTKALENNEFKLSFILKL